MLTTRPAAQTLVQRRRGSPRRERPQPAQPSLPVAVAGPRRPIPYTDPPTQWRARLEFGAVANVAALTNRGRFGLGHGHWAAALLGWALAVG